eukprot:TRINITY_DN17640_c0_g2_i1.p1 TRINITY_DN17640_c0_g2~~TRINITY_DN17640_c0_g2_i1.p1  ORF type:complete len:388 (+),score=32.37 TRINITY_DN17640_c0_g2_i1:65-1228(+)
MEAARDAEANKEWGTAISLYLGALEKIDMGKKTERAETLIGVGRCQNQMGNHAGCVESVTKAEMVGGGMMLKEILNLRESCNAVLENYVAAAADCQRLLESCETEQQRDDITSRLKTYRSAVSLDDETEMDPDYRGCSHYSRRCKLYCPECSTLTPCRICHDENADHKLDRFKISKIRCITCGTDQGPSAACEACSITFSDYYCHICHLWGSFPSPSAPADYIWHCDACGICRKGTGGGIGASGFAHCDKCASCWPIDSDHECIQSGSNTHCPVCLEDRHNSTRISAYLNCGHFMHVDCKREFLRSRQFACPICKKTISNEIFATIAAEVQLNKMPAEYDGVKAEVICNDCLEKNMVPYHFVAMRCPCCDSFNTTITKEPKINRPGS